MGLFGPSKQEREAMAARADAMATEDAAEARRLRAEAAEVRERGRTARYKDPEAVRVIAGHLETNARIAEDAARIERASAEQLRRPWWR